MGNRKISPRTVTECRATEKKQEMVEDTFKVTSPIRRRPKALSLTHPSETYTEMTIQLLRRKSLDDISLQNEMNQCSKFFNDILAGTSWQNITDRINLREAIIQQIARNPHSIHMIATLLYSKHQKSFFDVYLSAPTRVFDPITAVNFIQGKISDFLSSLEKAYILFMLLRDEKNQKIFCRRWQRYYKTPIPTRMMEFAELEPKIAYLFLFGQQGVLQEKLNLAQRNKLLELFPQARKLDQAKTDRFVKYVVMPTIEQEKQEVFAEVKQAMGKIKG